MTQTVVDCELCMDGVFHISFWQMCTQMCNPGALTHRHTHMHAHTQTHRALGSLGRLQCQCLTSFLSSRQQLSCVDSRNLEKRWTQDVEKKRWMRYVHRENPRQHKTWRLHTERPSVQPGLDLETLEATLPATVSPFEPNESQIQLNYIMLMQVL